MIISDEMVILILGLKRNPILQRANEISKMELSRGTHPAEDDLFPLTQRAFRTPFKAALSVQRSAFSHNQAQLFADRSVPKADSRTLTAIQFINR
jgi:hypothetical protein